MVKMLAVADADEGADVTETLAVRTSMTELCKDAFSDMSGELVVRRFNSWLSSLLFSSKYPIATIYLFVDSVAGYEICREYNRQKSDFFEQDEY